LQSHRGKADFVFAVAGRGPELGSLRARAKELGVANLFDLLGRVDDMPALIGASDVVILTSEKEGIPLILMEAMAMGRPVVSSNAGQAHELVAADSGFLVDIGDEETDRFAEVLDKLLDDTALRAALGVAGRRRVERDWDLRRTREEYRRLFV
jgi:glycosyltransferase involved in cell wall biosynthesis